MSPTDGSSDSPLTFGVVGLGYVGLPLAVEVGKSGMHVVGFDVSARVVETVNRGESHIGDVPVEAVAALRGAGILEATTDMARMGECDVISICVPTPLGKTRDPDLSAVMAAGEAVARTLRPGQLVVLESTTYPGTTREVLLPLFEARGLEVGTDFFLCFSPERVDPGNPVWKTRNTPKIMGGVTPACAARGKSVYEHFIDTIVPVSSPEAAELVKLLENTFRAVNIGLANETAQIADRLGVDVWEVIEAAATKPFGFMKFTPGPGLGGHCIPVDPYYLSWKMRTLNMRTRFIDLAGEVNGEMPAFVVGKVQEALNHQKMAVNGARVLVLGVAYKPDIEDVRESPAFDIIHELMALGAELRYHDPHVPELRDNGLRLTSIPLDRKALESADCVVVVTDHSTVDYAMVHDAARIVVDARNATARAVKNPVRRGAGWIVKGGPEG